MGHNNFCFVLVSINVNFKIVQLMEVEVWKTENSILTIIDIPVRM